MDKTRQRGLVRTVVIHHPDFPWRREGDEKKRKEGPAYDFSFTLWANWRGEEKGRKRKREGDFERHEHRLHWPFRVSSEKGKGKKKGGWRGHPAPRSQLRKKRGMEVGSTSGIRLELVGLAAT